VFQVGLSFGVKGQLKLVLTPGLINKTTDLAKCTVTPSPGGVIYFEGTNPFTLRRVLLRGAHGQVCRFSICNTTQRLYKIQHPPVK